MFSRQLSGAFQRETGVFATSGKIQMHRLTATSLPNDLEKYIQGKKRHFPARKIKKKWIKKKQQQKPNKQYFM